jgi:hypothetical protein
MNQEETKKANMKTGRVPPSAPSPSPSSFYRNDIFQQMLKELYVVKKTLCQQATLLAANPTSAPG